MSPALAGAIAAFAGFYSCFFTLGPTQSVQWGNAIAIVVGVIVTGAFYAVYLSQRARDDLMTPPVPPPADATPTPSLSAAQAVFLTIWLACATVGGLVSGYFMAQGGDSPRAVPLGEWVSVFLPNAAIGFLLGCVVGLVPAIPAAMVVWGMGKAHARKTQL